MHVRHFRGERYRWATGAEGHRWWSVDKRQGVLKYMHTALCGHRVEVDHRH